MAVILDSETGTMNNTKLSFETLLDQCWSIRNQEASPLAACCLGAPPAGLHHGQPRQLGVALGREVRPPTPGTCDPSSALLASSAVLKDTMTWARWARCLVTWSWPPPRATSGSSPKAEKWWRVARYLARVERRLEGTSASWCR